MAIILLISPFCYADSYEFLPVNNENLVLEFSGTTNMGEGIHKLEIRQLGYEASFYKDGKVPTNGYYLIYFSHEEYGPDILTKLDGHTPYIELVNDDLIEIQFTKGNNGHTKQLWELLGHTARLQSEETISWQDRKKFDK